METILYVISEQIKNISILLNPVIPLATGKILEMMNINSSNIKIDSIIKNNIIQHDIELKNLEILFKKVENDN